MSIAVGQVRSLDRSPCRRVWGKCVTSVTFLTRCLGAALLTLVAACSSSGRRDQEVTGPSTSVMPVVWECPAGYEVKEGLNTDFPHKGLKRAFVVYPARNAVGPVPVWVPLTGSVESTNDNLTVPRSGANSLLADKGSMVIGYSCRVGPFVGLY